jgi:hypothetical protein
MISNHIKVRFPPSRFFHRGADAFFPTSGDSRSLPLPSTCAAKTKGR